MSFPESEVIHGTSTKEDGNMAFRYGEQEEVEENRRRFLEMRGGVLENCVVMVGEHEEKITIVHEADRGRGATNGNESIVTEALITNDREVILFLTTGDCLPVAFYDPVQGVVAIAHLGWKPTDRELARKVVEEMGTAFGSKPEDIQVNIGPCIHKESYVQPTLAQEDDPRWQPHVEKLDTEEFAIDLIGFNVAALIAAGVLAENIDVSDVDTASSENHFSHYRSKKTDEPDGRIATIMGLR